MSIRISGFNSSGEVRLVNDDGKTVGYGELLVENAYSIEKDDEFGLSVKVVWTPEYQEFQNLIAGI